LTHVPPEIFSVSLPLTSKPPFGLGLEKTNLFVVLLNMKDSPFEYPLKHASESGANEYGGAQLNGLRSSNPDNLE
jgi:hypothetical protein